MRPNPTAENFVNDSNEHRWSVLEAGGPGRTSGRLGGGSPAPNRKILSPMTKRLAGSDEFRFIDPPFQFNSPTISTYAPEITGNYYLNLICRRFGWDSLAGKRLLDFGCGVRFARTIFNLDLDIGLYAGVDVNAEVIAWLSEHVDDPRFRFDAIDMVNPMYSPNGAIPDRGALREMGLSGFDAACLCSVITHQPPQEAALIFAMLYDAVRPGGLMYFTAFVDKSIERWLDYEQANPCLYSCYHPDYICELASNAGWMVERSYPGSLPFNQPAFVCRK
jgi:SAM-dependent methyltransferase